MCVKARYEQNNSRTTKSQNMLKTTTTFTFIQETHSFFFFARSHLDFFLTRRCVGILFSYVLGFIFISISIFGYAHTRTHTQCKMCRIYGKYRFLPHICIILFTCHHTYIYLEVMVVCNRTDTQKYTYISINGCVDVDC